jgi:sigma-E factor negative regulatory protein RseC
MIEERAQVVEIKGSTLVLQAQRQSACSACSASSGCGTSVLSRVVGRKFTRFQAENNVNARVGDTVIVAIPEDTLVKGSLVMYLVPILGMFVTGLLADYSLDPASSYRDIMIALIAVAGFAGGAFVARKYFSSHATTHRYTPVVLRKIFD